MRNYQAVILVLLCLCSRGKSVCSNEYGGEPCKYVPALPGKTPSCARPGYTFCENPDYYPSQVIHYLVENWAYNYDTLLSNETPEDFSAYAVPSPYNQSPNIVYQHLTVPSVYGPPGYVPRTPYSEYLPPSRLNTHSQQNLSQFQDYTNSGQKEVFYQDPPSNVRYNFNEHPFLPQHNSYYPLSTSSEVTSYNQHEWWKRHVHQSLKNNRRKRFLNNSDVESIRNITKTKRQKRQTSTSEQSLCQVRSQYITPRAALNNKGNWMYIVNMPDEKMTQLVKSETCVSQECSGLCSLPFGFTSRCEQKYIQKRLVALESTGNRLYTDVFWIPSCCACTIIRNQ